MIKLETDCNDCIYSKMCKNKDNAKNDMEKLKRTNYGKGPNDDYGWDLMMRSRNVVITFSCPDFDDVAIRRFTLGGYI